MNLFQGSRSRTGHWIPSVLFDFIGLSEFFQQPQDALRSGIVEMMYGNHAFFLPLMSLGLRFSFTAFQR
jgi:hypothetical protein